MLRSLKQSALPSTSFSRFSQRGVCRRIPVTNPAKLEIKKNIPVLLLKDDVRLGKKGDLVAVNKSRMAHDLHKKQKAAYIISTGVARTAVPHPEAVSVREALDRVALSSKMPVLDVLSRARKPFKSGLPKPWQVKLSDQFKPSTV